MGTNKLKPKLMLTVDVHNFRTLPLIVTNTNGDIQYMTHISKLADNYTVRQTCLSVIDQIMQKYDVDTILFEQNRLFIDKIDKYPDPMVLRNIMLGFGIQVSIEDRYYKSKVLLSIPDYEWRRKVLHSKVTYSIDLYKSHVLLRQDLTEEQLCQIKENNYYEAICLSESILFDTLMHKKYQINKGDIKGEKR